MGKELFLDTETTTRNKGNPHDPENALVSYAGLLPGAKPVFAYYTDPSFISTIRSHLDDATIVVGFNVKFDLHWLRRYNLWDRLKTKRIFDLQLAEYVLSGQQTPFQSLNELRESYGLPVKLDLVKQYWDQGVDTKDIPVHVLEEYNIDDIVYLPEIYNYQLKLLTPQQIQLVFMMGEDMKTLLDAEYNGIKFDVKKAKDIIDQYKNEVISIEAELNTLLPSDLPPGCFNWDSGDHLSLFLYGGTHEFAFVKEVAQYKTGPRAGQSFNRYTRVPVTFNKRFQPVEGTEIAKTKSNPEATTRMYKTDDPTLRQLLSRRKEDKQLLNFLSQRAKAIKVVEMVTSLSEKISEMNWGEYLHGQFNQNVARTSRLSSSNPNMQNTSPEVDQLLVSRFS